MSSNQPLKKQKDLEVKKKNALQSNKEPTVGERINKHFKNYEKTYKILAAVFVPIIAMLTLVFEIMRNNDSENVDQISFNARYFCSTTAFAPNTMPPEFRDWLAAYQLIYGQPIKTSYWSRVANDMPREYLFILLINRGARIDITDITEATWQIKDYEPLGWNDKKDIVGQDKMEEQWAYMLLVADREPQRFPSLFNVPTEPFFSPDVPFLSEETNMDSSQDLEIFFDCGSLESWQIEKISFKLTLKPDALPPFEYFVTLSDEEDNAISPLSIP